MKCSVCKGTKTAFYEWSNGIAQKCETCKGTGDVPDKVEYIKWLVSHANGYEIINPDDEDMILRCPDGVEFYLFDFFEKEPVYYSDFLQKAIEGINRACLNDGKFWFEQGLSIYKQLMIIVTLNSSILRITIFLLIKPKTQHLNMSIRGRWNDR